MTFRVGDFVRRTYTGRVGTVTVLPEDDFLVVRERHGQRDEMWTLQWVELYDWPELEGRQAGGINRKQVSGPQRPTGLREEGPRT